MICYWPTGHTAAVKVAFLEPDHMAKDPFTEHLILFGSLRMMTFDSLPPTATTSITTTRFGGKTCKPISFAFGEPSRGV